MSDGNRLPELMNSNCHALSHELCKAPCRQWFSLTPQTSQPHPSLLSVQKCPFQSDCTTHDPRGILVHAHLCVLAHAGYPILGWLFPCFHLQCLFEYYFLSNFQLPSFPLISVCSALSLLYILPALYFYVRESRCLVYVPQLCLPMPMADITKQLWNPARGIHLRTVIISFCWLTGLDKGCDYVFVELE